MIVIGEIIMLIAIIIMLYIVGYIGIMSLIDGLINREFDMIIVGLTCIAVMLIVIGSMLIKIG